MFLSQKREIPLSASEVLRFLSVYPLDLERQYLEYLLEQQKSEEVEHHSKLVCNYIDTVLQLKPAVDLPFGLRVEAGKEAGMLGSIRTKLIQMLGSPTYFFDIHLVLQKLQSTTLYEEMILLHKKLENHRTSLELIIHNLHDFAMAERYCVEVYENSRTQPDELNPLLITVVEICIGHVDANGKSDEIGQFALHIMTKYAKWIDSVRALELLPDDIPLSSLKLFTEQIIQSSHYRNRHSKVIANLNRMHLLKSQAEVARGVSKRVCLRAASVCPVCKKYIGDQSVFVVYPDCTVVHVKCADKNKKVHPVTGINFEYFPVNLSEIVSDDQILYPPKVL